MKWQASGYFTKSRSNASSYPASFHSYSPPLALSESAHALIQLFPTCRKGTCWNEFSNLLTRSNSTSNTGSAPNKRCHVSTAGALEDFLPCDQEGDDEHGKPAVSLLELKDVNAQDFSRPQASDMVRCAERDQASTRIWDEGVLGFPYSSAKHSLT